MDGIVDLISRYKKAVSEAEECGKKIAEAIVNVLRQIIPDLTYSIGWEEAGVETICFWSDSRDTTRYLMMKDAVFLERVIVEVFPELDGYVDTPFGVYLTKEEAEKAKQLLQKLREQK